MEFANLVKKVRKDLNYSQEQLARALNISFSTVNRWENSKVKPSPMAKEVFVNFCNNQGIIIDKYMKGCDEND